jgi:hypothetical protein
MTKCKREKVANCTAGQRTLKIVEIVLIICIILVVIGALILSITTGNTVTKTIKDKTTAKKVTSEFNQFNEVNSSIKPPNVGSLNPVTDIKCLNSNLNNSVSTVTQGNNFRDAISCENSGNGTWVNGTCQCLRGRCGASCDQYSYDISLLAVGNTNLTTSSLVTDFTGVTGINSPVGLLDFPIENYTGAYGFKFTPPNFYELFLSPLIFTDRSDINNLVPYNTNPSGVQNVYLYQQNQSVPYFNDGVFFIRNENLNSVNRYWATGNTDAIFIDSSTGTIIQIDNSSVGYSNIINNVLASGGPSTSVTVSLNANLSNPIVYVDGATENFASDFGSADTFFVMVTQT